MFFFSIEKPYILEAYVTIASILVVILHDIIIYTHVGSERNVKVCLLVSTLLCVVVIKITVRKKNIYIYCG